MAIAPNPLLLAPPVRAASPALAVPGEFVERLEAAQAAGIADASKFARLHGPGDWQLIADWAIRRLPFAPKSDASDLAELHSVARTRTPEGIERARFWASHGLDEEWEQLLSQYTSRVGPRQAKAARKLLEDAFLLTNTATQISKSSNARQRPFVVDPTLELVVDRPGNNPSYPSGHTSAAFAAGLVLSKLMPDRTAEFMGLAQEASWARVYSGVHFPSDVVAGVQLASTVVGYLTRISGVQPRSGTSPAGKAIASAA
ncbi:MAG: phosphatase family protein [Thermoleophilia bacterium]|nr:phosphatase family protein [Thermoleophilia bacterium]